MRIALLVAAYAVIAVIAYVSIGTQVAPCLGGATNDNTACNEAWRASQPWWQRLFDTPLVPTIGFLAASALTIWLSRRRRT